MTRLSRSTYRALRLLAAPLLLFFSLGAHADKPPENPARFEEEIAAIERRDRLAPPAQGGILFIGSSNIRKWEVREAFPDLPVTNHGFGGSHASDSVYFFDRMVTPVAPKLVVFHAGGNDLSYGRSPEQLVADVKEFISKLHAALPRTRLIYIGPFPAPVRAGLRDKFVATERLARGAIHGDRLVSFLDPGKALLAHDGAIRPELYESDRLHLNRDGYALLTRYADRPIRRAYASVK